MSDHLTIQFCQVWCLLNSATLSILAFIALRQARTLTKTLKLFKETMDTLNLINKMKRGGGNEISVLPN